MVRVFKTIEGAIHEIQEPQEDCWIAMTNPTATEIFEISERFGIEVDDLRAPLDEEERSRLVIEDNYTLILVDIPMIEDKEEKDRYVTIPLGIVLTDEVIITVCLEETGVLTPFMQGRIRSFYTFKKTRLILQILYRNATLFLQYLRNIDRKSGDIEEKLHISQKNQELIELLELEKSLVYFTTSLRSNEVVLEKMVRAERIKKYPDDEELLEDVKTQKCSTSDPESGWFRKGEHKHVFAYAVETACDKHGWILGYTVHPGNEHDSRTFKALYDKISKLNPQMVVADAGYKTPAIAHRLLEDGIQPLFPYTRPKTKEGFFGKHEFAYDEYYDCYICPGAHILTYSTTNRSGYKEYKSCGEHCAGCQYLSKCTESKDHVKLITRHVWEEYMEVAEDIRHTIGNRQIYQLRKETIERIFGTAKEQHGFRYTQYVGKARMEMKAGLTFACMNLKKLAKILEKRGWNTARFLLILKKIKRKEVLKEKWCWA